MPPVIPRRTREITAAWLTDVLRDADIEAPPVRDLDVEQINVGTGFAGRVFRLRPHYDGEPDGAPTSMIMKMPSGDPAMRELFTELRGYEIESVFYRDLASNTPTAVPRCFWNASDTENGDFALILEDLEGYNVGGQTEDEVDIDLVTALVREAARLHAAWWNSDVLLAHPRLPQPSGPETLIQQRLAEEGLGPWRHGIGQRYSTDAIEGVESAVSQLPVLARTAAEGATTLVHGDYRLDNLMWSPERADRPLVVIDWQLLRCGSGAYDLAYLLGQSIPTETRRQHEDEWLALYLGELGRPDYDEERLRRDLAIGLLQSMWVPLMGTVLTARTREAMRELPPGPTLDSYEAAVSAGDALNLVMSDRNIAAIVDHDAVRVLN